MPEEQTQTLEGSQTPVPIEATNEQSESVSASASAVEQSEDKNEVCLGS